MTNQEREQLVAEHVEALLRLGWEWRGRGLEPRIRTNWDPEHNIPKSSHKALRTG